MYSGREQRLAGRVDIDVSGPRQQYRMSSGYRKGRPFNRGKGVSPGRLNMVRPAVGRDPARLGGCPKLGKCLLVRRESRRTADRAGERGTATRQPDR